jgi:hypothetical protein
VTLRVSDFSWYKILINGLAANRELVEKAIEGFSRLQFKKIQVERLQQWAVNKGSIATARWAE